MAHLAWSDVRCVLWPWPSLLSGVHQLVFSRARRLELDAPRHSWFSRGPLGRWRLC